MIFQIFIFKKNRFDFFQGREKDLKKVTASYDLPPEGLKWLQIWFHGDYKYGFMVITNMISWWLQIWFHGDYKYGFMVITNMVLWWLLIWF